MPRWIKIEYSTENLTNPIKHTGRIGVAIITVWKINNGGKGWWTSHSYTTIRKYNLCLSFHWSKKRKWVYVYTIKVRSVYYEQLQTVQDTSKIFQSLQYSDIIIAAVYPNSTELESITTHNSFKNWVNTVKWLWLNLVLPPDQAWLNRLKPYYKPTPIMK